MELGGGRFAVSSSKLTLGSLGAAELVLGALSGLSTARLADVVGTAAESDAVTTVLAGVSLVETELAALATVAGLSFFGYAVYEFLPRMFPQAMHAVAGRTGYRLLATGIVVVTARVAERALGGGVTSVGTVLVPTVAALLLSLGYVAWLTDRETADVAAASATASEWIGTSKSGEPTADGDSRSPFETLSDVVSVGVMLALPVPILGVAVVAAGRISPLPELLAIAWVAVDGVERRSNRSLSDRLPDRERADVEGSMFDLVANAVRSQKGVPAVTVVLVGFGVPVSLVGVMNGELGRFAAEGARAVGTDTLFAWSVLGMVGILFASGWRRHGAKVARVGFGAATLVLSTVGVVPDTAAFKLVGAAFLVWPFLTVAGDRVQARAGA